jgi:hypothetical protein
MKARLSRILYFFGMLLLSAGVVRADSFSFEDWGLQGLYSYQYLAQGQSYSGKWDISDDPNWSSELNITSINSDFWFADDSDADTCITWIKTGYWKEVTEKKWSHGKWKYVTKSVWVDTGGYNQTIDNPDNYEEVDIWVGNYQAGDNAEVDGVISYTVNLTTYEMTSYDLSTILSVELDLQADGMLNYTVKAVKGDTYLKETRLTVTAETIPVEVPDAGSTATMLALGLIGLAAYRRRN